MRVGLLVALLDRAQRLGAEERTGKQRVMLARLNLRSATREASDFAGRATESTLTHPRRRKRRKCAAIWRGVSGHA
jgi:hypothetical protein